MGIDGSELKARAPRAKKYPPIPPEDQAVTHATTADLSRVSGSDAELQRMLSDDNGWLRLVPSDGGRTLYCKWKWTHGPLSNRYVMTVGPHYEVENLLRLLADKKEAAEQGRGPSAQDRYHNG